MRMLPSALLAALLLAAAGPAWASGGCTVDTRVKGKPLSRVCSEVVDSLSPSETAAGCRMLNRSYPNAAITTTPSLTCPRPSQAACLSTRGNPTGGGAYYYTETAQDLDRLRMGCAGAGGTWIVKP